MEIFDVLGIQHKVGTYQNQPFDNMVFSVCVPADVSKGEVGQICSLIKIKTSLLTVVPKVGDKVSPQYDRYGRVVAIQILDK